MVIQIDNDLSFEAQDKGQSKFNNDQRAHVLDAETHWKKGGEFTYAIGLKNTCGVVDRLINFNYS